MLTSNKQMLAEKDNKKTLERRQFPKLINTLSSMPNTYSKSETKTQDKYSWIFT